MNPADPPADNLPYVFHFRATQLGRYFHGYCARVRADEHRVTLLGRKLVRHVFEPGGLAPRVEVKSTGTLILLKKDFHIITTAVIPPRWFQTEN
jgi:hypothetical protein